MFGDGASGAPRPAPAIAQPVREVGDLPTYTASRARRTREVMLKFRETLWFKKGELDAEAAAKAAPDEPAAVDLLPVEDRYADDGSLCAGDSVSFGLHTGHTQHIATIDGGVPADARRDGADAVPALVGELKRGRRRILAALGASIVTLVAIAVCYAM